MENNQEKVGANGQYELIGRRRSEIPDAERLQTLQGKLYQKAKQEKWYKFYSFRGLSVKANDEIFRKAVCGKTARTV